MDVASLDSSRDRLPPLLATKFVPPPRSGTVHRRRLLDRLRTSGERRMTLVVAPAGWGKSTLLADWIRDPDEERVVAWLALDEADGHPVRFWSYVVAALRTVEPDLGASVLAALRGPGVEPIELLPVLIQELADLPGQRVLVLDDYHVIDDPQVHEGLEFLLAYLPQSLHVVVATRHDPALPIARLRARGELVEIRASDLAFDAGEATALLAAEIRLPLDDVTVTRLLDRTEGWAAGLYLAALSVRGAEDPDRRLAELRGDDWYVDDYLASEVIGNLPADVRDFLTTTAILDRLSGPLCDAVLERDDSRQVLAEVERANLFLIPLDRHRTWYRLHRLLHDAFARRLSDTIGEREMVDLHRRAAAWFEGAGETEREVGHLMAAGDHELAAARLVATHRSFLDRGDLDTFTRLGDALPRDVHERDSNLAWALAAMHGLSGRLGRALDLLDLAEAALTKDTPPPAGWTSAESAIGSLGAALHPTSDRRDVVATARRAILMESDPHTDGHVLSRAALGLALSGAGDRQGAADAYLDALLALGRHPVDTFATLQIVGWAAIALIRADRIQAADELVTTYGPRVPAFEAAAGGAAAPATLPLHTAAGLLARRRGDTAVAVVELERAAELARLFPLPSVVVGALGDLAELLAVTGEVERARELLAEAGELAAEGPVVPAAVRRLAQVSERIGVGAAQRARRSAALVEHLTDRELSILRALQGSLTLREIGGELYLSLNTVKGYTKALYRKLGVSTRAEAIDRGRELSLI